MELFSGLNCCSICQIVWMVMCIGGLMWYSGWIAYTCSCEPWQPDGDFMRSASYPPVLVAATVQAIREIDQGIADNNWTVPFATTGFALRQDAARPGNWLVRWDDREDHRFWHMSVDTN